MTVNVTQADLDEAANYGCGFCPDGTEEDLAQAFARHRTEAYAAGLAEGGALGIEAAAVACEEQRDAYLSPQYATGQPLSSIMERMACTTCRDGIRNLDPATIRTLRAEPVSDDLIARLEGFEGSDDLGNGDFSVCYQAAAELRTLRAERDFHDRAAQEAIVLANTAVGSQLE